MTVPVRRINIFLNSPSRTKRADNFPDKGESPKSLKRLFGDDFGDDITKEPLEAL
jgi:hypothetical protein